MLHYYVGRKGTDFSENSHDRQTGKNAFYLWKKSCSVWGEMWVQRGGKRQSQKERNDWKDPLINVYWYENEALSGNCSARIQPVFHKHNKTKLKLAKLTFMH